MDIGWGSLWGAIFNTGLLITSAIHRKDAAEQVERQFNELIDWNRYLVEHPIRNVSFSLADQTKNYYSILVIGVILVFVTIVAIIFFTNSNKANA